MTVSHKLLPWLLAALAALGAWTQTGLGQAGKDKKDKKEVKKEPPPPPPKKEEPRDKTPPLLTLKGHADWVNSVAYSKDGKWLVTASRDKTVRVWDAATGKELVLVGDRPRKEEKKEPPAKEEKKKPSPDAFPTNVKDAVFSPDQARLAATSGQWNKEKKEWVGEIRLVDAKTGKQVAALHGHGAEIEGIAFSPDGKLLASVSEDQTVKLWDLAAGKEKLTLKGHTAPVLAVAFNKDGTRLATASEDRTVRLWDVASGKELTADKGGLRLEGLPPPGPPKEAKPPAKDPKKPAAKDPKKDPKKEAKGPPPPKGPELRDMTCVAFSPDGGKLAAGNLDGTIFLWEVGTGKLLKKIQGPEGIWSIAFSPDGQRLASGGWNDAIRVWSVATGQKLLQRNGHERTVTAVAFSPDGQRLATSGIDGLVKVWPVAK